MSCRRATELISASMDRPLTRGERVALRVHLACCTHCRRFKRQIASIRAVLQRCAGRLDGSAEQPNDADEATVSMPRAARERVRQVLAETG